MKKFFLDAVIKPGLAIAFVLGFGLPWVFVGFQTVVLQGRRDLNGKATFIVSREHFFGLVKVEQVIHNVEKASVSFFEGGSGGSVNRQMVSSVVLIAANQEFPVFFSASSVDDELKSFLVTEVNMFLADKNQTDYTGTFAMRNMFGWIGLPFAAIGLFGLLRWPYTVLEKWNEYKRSLR